MWIMKRALSVNTWLLPLLSDAFVFPGLSAAVPSFPEQRRVDVCCMQRCCLDQLNYELEGYCVSCESCGHWMQPQLEFCSPPWVHALPMEPCKALLV